MLILPLFRWPVLLPKGEDIQEGEIPVQSQGHIAFWERDFDYPPTTGSLVVLKSRGKTERIIGRRFAK